ncbi:MAG: S8 family serine peptidase [Armatimonadetes bacterium]|nr:S8 family serine peptidase [Armatimonadota bacterium]
MNCRGFRARFLKVVVPTAAVAGLAAAAFAQDFAPHRILVKFKPGVTQAQADRVIGNSGARKADHFNGIDTYVLQLPAQASEKAFASALAKRSDVEFAEPDWAMKPAAAVNDPSLASEWYVNKTQASSTWAYSSGMGVTIAILDTGCDPTHPDLVGRYVGGWNTYDNTSDTHDVYGHGTAVAGCAAATGNNSLGIAGMAYGSQIMPMRISDVNGYGYSSTISSALTWASDHGAKVANISYQMTGSSAVANAAKYFMDHGGVVCVSSGNTGAADTTADSPYILTVGATDSADAKASFSTTGADVDLTAPGVSIYTTNNGGGYGSWSGTSFSAPITAGAAALVLSANPGLTGYQVYDLLKNTSDDLGSAGWDASFGAGRVNSYKAVMSAKGLNTQDTIPPSVSFSNPTDGASVAGSVSIGLNATDNVGVTSMKLYVDGALAQSWSVVPFSYSWDTTKLANGSHTLLAVAADSAGNTSQVQATVNVNNVVDTTAPSATIVSPGIGVVVGTTLSVKTSASDNMGVVKTELWLDGKLAASSTLANPSFSLNTRKWARGNHTLVCRAYDAAGNVGSSSNVTVSK